MGSMVNRTIVNPELKKQAIANLVCEQLFMDPSLTLQMVLEQVQQGASVNERAEEGYGDAVRGCHFAVRVHYQVDSSCL